MPKVSIIVPIYNTKNYLEHCINSIIKQTLQEIELICINDCSTDGSLQIIKKIMALDSRVVLIDNETNLSQGESRNRGLAVAKGEFIWFVDSDDFLLADNVLEELYNKAKTTNADVVRFEARLFDENYKELATPEYFYNAPYLVNSYEGEKTIALYCYLEDRKRAMWCNFFKKDFLVLNNFKLPSEALSEDQISVYWLLLAKKIVVIDLPCYGYLKRGSSSINKKKFTSDDIINHFERAKRILSFIKRFLQERNMLANHEALFMNTFYNVIFQGYNSPAFIKILSKHPSVIHDIFMLFKNENLNKSKLDSLYFSYPFYNVNLLKNTIYLLKNDDYASQKKFVMQNFNYKNLSAKILYYLCPLIFIKLHDRITKND